MRALVRIASILLAAGAVADGRDTFLISRRGPYLERDGQFVRIPVAVVRKIRARRPLA